MSKTKLRPNRDGTPGRSITGRDGYILAQALAYAITAIERLPEQLREYSNQEDMKPPNRAFPQVLLLRHELELHLLVMPVPYPSIRSDHASASARSRRRIPVSRPPGSNEMHCSPWH
jgi:hypothetical protein